jgi:hypothetical protein
MHWPGRTVTTAARASERDVEKTTGVIYPSVGTFLSTKYLYANFLTSDGWLAGDLAHTVVAAKD